MRTAPRRVRASGRIYVPFKGNPGKILQGRRQGPAGHAHWQHRRKNDDESTYFAGRHG